MTKCKKRMKEGSIRLSCDRERIFVGIDVCNSGAEVKQMIDIKSVKFAFQNPWICFSELANFRSAYLISHYRKKFKMLVLHNLKSL